MLMLIYILICLFLLLIGYQMILAIYPKSIIEGLDNINTSPNQDYQPYNTNDPNNSLILPQQNAGNIEVLKGRVDNYYTLQDDVKKDISNIKINVDTMQTQIDSLVQQQADYAQEMAGSTPPDVTGTDEETTENVEDFIQADEEDK